MKRLFFLLLILLTFAGRSAVSPTDALSAARQYQGLDDHGLSVVQTYYTLLLSGFGILTPSQALTAAAGFYGMDDHSLNVVQSYYLANMGLYGANSTNNVLVLPSVFSPSATDWNPLIVTNAGTAAANQSYYRIQTNFNTVQANMGYAVWTNANNGLCIVLNDTNQVPAVILSNLWTLQDMSGNYKYDLVNPSVIANDKYNTPNPFGTWEVSGLGGSAGASPVPDVGPLPNLIFVTRAMPTNGTLTLSPGFYDIGQYTWFPTNLTVVGNGALIHSANTLEGIHPYGPFSMFGVGYSNAACYFTAGGVLSGGVMLKVDNTQSNLLFDGGVWFACTDGPNGSAPDNWNITFKNGVFGSLWDVATFGMVVGATNCTANFLACRFYSKTNGLSTANSMVAANVNQVRVVGCVMQAGPGFTTGGGIIQTTANTTNEVSGTVINLSASAGGTVFKIKQTAGTMVVPVGEFSSADVTGTITWKGGTWRKEIIYGSSVFVGSIPASAFQANLFASSSTVPGAGMVQSALRPMPLYGYYSNFTLGYVGPTLLGGATNFTFGIKTNVIKTAGTPAAAVTSSLNGVLNTGSGDVFTNISGIGLGWVANLHGYLEVTPGAVPNGCTNVWWRFEHWFQDNTGL